MDREEFNRIQEWKGPYKQLSKETQEIFDRADEELLEARERSKVFERNLQRNWHKCTRTRITKFINDNRDLIQEREAALDFLRNNMLEYWQQAREARIAGKTMYDFHEDREKNHRDRQYYLQIAIGDIRKAARYLSQGESSL
ncbi:hypothetical protein ACEQ8H_004294 [Pleosporales sp. CAS-2024a]